MTSLSITTAFLGVGLAVVIIILLRRDHLYITHGLFWLVVAVVAVTFGFWPSLIDQLAKWIGIAYSPAALLLGACMILFIRVLYLDICITRVERDVRLLNQRLAMYEIDSRLKKDDAKDGLHNTR